MLELLAQDAGGAEGGLPPEAAGGAPVVEEAVVEDAPLPDGGEVVEETDIEKEAKALFASLK